MAKATAKTPGVTKPKVGDPVRMDGEDCTLTGFRKEGATARLTGPEGEDISCSVAELLWDDKGHWFIPGRN